jgi:outer membrane receptor protein involved in Fe transport
MNQRLYILLNIFLISGIVLGGTTGKITGKVIDAKTKEALPMANVVVIGTSAGASTDLNGNFSILQVPPGTFDVKASMLGFDTVLMKNVKVQVDLTTSCNFSLSPTVLDIGQEITVVAGRPIIQKDATFSSSRLTGEAINNMPTVTTVQDIVAQQAGVVGEGMHINVRGGRSGEILFVVDGMSARDPQSAMASRTTQEQVMDFSSNPVDETTGRSGGLSIPANAIAEVEVITGGFSAEYGNAMSGVVNVVTKEGGSDYTGRIQYITDDLGQGKFKTPYGDGSGLRTFSQNSDQFEFNIGGPEPITGLLLPSLGVKMPFKTSLFISANGDFSDASSGFGPAYYAPTGENRSDQLKDKMFGIPLPFKYGNRMDNRYSSLSNLTLRFSPSFKVMVSHQTDVNFYDEYDHAFKNIPENYWDRNENNLMDKVKINHTLSPSTFYELLIGHFRSDYLLTPGGMTPPEVYKLWDSLDGVVGDGKGTNYQDYDRDDFYDAGYPARGTYHHRMSDKYTAKIDVSSQVHFNHYLKTGIEMNYYKMEMQEIKYPDAYHPDQIIDHGKWPEYGIFRDFYTRYPTTGAFYIQDKIEYESLIINIGLRYDFYAPGQHVNDKVTEGTEVGIKGLKFKHNFDPRLGVSHPITDRDVLYFQFGRFTQEVDWQFLYLQDTQTSRAYKLYGNPNLNSQETTQYEVGIRHAFNDEIKIEATAFYKDYSGLLNVETRGKLNLTYSVYVNRDYGSSRGFEIKFNKRYSNYTSANITYTYSFAMGKSSSYRQGYDYGYQGKPVPVREWPLDWDVRHVANVNFDFRVLKGQPLSILGYKLPEDWGVDLIWHIESGRPYTPAGKSATQFTTPNSARTPYRAYLNLRANKYFRLGKMRLVGLVEVNNLFNKRSIRAVNSETGDTIGYGRAQDINPSAYYPGRNILFGFAFEF